MYPFQGVAEETQLTSSTSYNMQKEYTKREIDLIIKPLHDKHDSFDEKLDKILHQTSKTNGRVTKLELWKAWALGAFAVVVPNVLLIVLVVLSFFGIIPNEGIAEDTTAILIGLTPLLNLVLRFVTKEPISF